MTRLLPALLAIAVVPAVFGQERPSHAPIPRDKNVDPKALFEEKFQQTQIRGEVEKLLGQLGKGQGSGLTEQIQKMLRDNPDLLKQAREMLHSSDPKTRDLVRSTIQNSLQNNPNLQGMGISADDLRRQMESVLTGKPAEPLPRPDQASRARPRRDAAKDDARTKWQRSLADWAERMNKSKAAEPLKNSPAFKGMLADITKAGLDTLKNGNGEGMDAQFARWQDRWQAISAWLPSEVPSALKDRINNIEMPVPENWSPHFDTPSGFGSLPAPAVGSTASIVQIAAYLGAGAAIFVLIRRMWGRTTIATRRRRELARSIDGTLAGRADVIRAFETLTLMRHGDSARAWHHRASAAGFPADERDAADRLASLYETARYAPGAPEPTTDELVTARRDIARLAGTI
ncbi:MAG: hypothetical protein U0746_07295 [Gemmataceae bacterium]